MGSLFGPGGPKVAWTGRDPGGQTDLTGLFAPLSLPIGRHAMICTACRAEAGDNGRFCPMCGAPLAGASAAREARKNVAILFMDLVGSTALAERLDPEPLRQLMDRYFAAAAAAIAEYGGAVEKFIGDAVMAVFGATVSHEDDALRAIKAAADTLSQVSDLNTGLAATLGVTLEVRCGVCSGEVMAITSAGGDFRVIGDPVNTAARLQTAAQPGEILVDSDSAAMARGAVALESVDPLILKGKAQPVSAWRVTSAEPVPDAAPLPLTALIGRDDELDELRQTFRRVTRRQQLCLVTVLGAPGIGKTRLVRDFVAQPPADVHVLAGRCSAYGRGITYKPLAEMIASWPGGWPGLAELLGASGEQGDRAIRCLDAVAADGHDSQGDHVGVEDISWAVRHLLTVLGERKPVVMIWEDLHWAAPTLLDLIDEVTVWLTDVPVLLVCVARSELLEARPDWGGGKPCAMTLEVGPLSAAESAELAASLAARDDVYAHQADALCERVAVQCEGNPLFAELMLDVFAETAPGARLPPTISALLTARLDQLPHAERQLIEVASAIGRDLRLPVLRAMAAVQGIDQGEVAGLVARLVRRRVFQRAGQDEVRFAQALLRDTAYALSPKTRREQWHVFLADWFGDELAGHQGSATQAARMAFAYHVEAARLLGKELRPGVPGRPERADAAAQILISEGMIALHRKDLPGAAALLERGRDLLAPGDPQRAALMLYICDSWLGLSDAGRALAALAGPDGPDRPDGLLGRIQRCIVMLRLGQADPADIAAAASQLEAELDRDPANDRAWCRLHQLHGYLYLATERVGLAETQLRLALDRATALADQYEQDRMRCGICELGQWAPTTVSSGLALCAELAVKFADNGTLLVPVLLTRARLAALRGDFELARNTVLTLRGHASDLHLDLADAATCAVSGLVESLAGDHAAALAGYQQSQALLAELGQDGAMRGIQACAARELFELGRTSDAAEAAAALSAASCGPDLRTTIQLKALAARIDAENGRADLAVIAASEAVTMSEQTDDLCLQGDCLADLAVVLHSAGQLAGAAVAADRACGRYQAKEATWLSKRVERWLASS